MEKQRRKQQKTTFSIGQSYHDRLDEMSKLTGMSKSQVTRIALDKLATEMGLAPLKQYVPNLLASHGAPRS